MLGKFISKLTQHAFKQKRLRRPQSPTHAMMREDHFRREHAELCRQLRHQQHFYGYRTKCD